MFLSNKKQYLATHLQECHQQQYALCYITNKQISDAIGSISLRTLILCGFSHLKKKVAYDSYQGHT